MSDSANGRGFTFLLSDTPPPADSTLSTRQPESDTSPVVAQRPEARPAVTRRDDAQPAVTRQDAAQPAVKRRSDAQPAVARRSDVQPAASGSQGAFSLDLGELTGVPAAGPAGVPAAGPAGVPAADATPRIKKIEFPVKKAPPKTRFADSVGQSRQASPEEPATYEEPTDERPPASTPASTARTSTPASTARTSTPASTARTSTAVSGDDSWAALRRPPAEVPVPRRTRASARPTASTAEPPLHRDPAEVAAFPATGPDLLDAPCDLDLPGDLEERVDSGAVGPQWSQDTPTAADLWRQARSSMSRTARAAAALGSRGVATSRGAASHLSGALRQRLEARAQARSQRESEEFPPNQLEARAQRGHETDPAAVPGDRTSGAPARDEGSVVARYVARLLWGAAKKVAAPASAVGAAALVYALGTQFFGGEAPSWGSDDSPDIPELGTLEGQQGAKAPALSAAKPAAGAPTGHPALAKRSVPGVDSGPAPMQTEQTAMPDGLSWPGKGLIEVVTAEDELIYVDGVFTGRGPLRRIPVDPGDHEISIRKDGTERTGVIAVQADRCSRAVFKAD